jgi:hypothetical protein
MLNNENDDRYQLLLTLTQFSVAAFQTNKEKRDENCKNLSIKLTFFFSRCVNNKISAYCKKNIWSNFCTLFAPYTMQVTYSRATEQHKKSSKLAKIFQRTDILLLFTCFLTSFNFFFFFVFFLLNTSSYIHINYARSLWR